MTAPRDFMRSFLRSIGEVLAMLRLSIDATNDRVEVSNQHSERIARDVAQIRTNVHTLLSLHTAEVATLMLIQRHMCSEDKPSKQEWDDAIDRLRSPRGDDDGL